ncbi:MAG: C2H2-type zinc finger protein [Dehalococcoidia bacterium]|nr:MAG: C2H2-type zinc finger protein [Dehalococcoidia bacterium]
MFKCKECGKEFADWHALGGHMRTHRAKKERSVALPTDEEQRKERLSLALGKLSELSPQEAWQIVVNWIMDVHHQLQLKDEIIQSYRLRLQDSEARVQGVQSELKKLQQTVEEKIV